MTITRIYLGLISTILCLISGIALAETTRTTLIPKANLSHVMGSLSHSTGPSLDAVFSQMPNRLVWQSLASKASSGVKVRVILSRSGFNLKKSRKLLRDLESKSADIRILDMSITHSFIVNGSTLLVGSALSRAGQTRTPLSSLTVSHEESNIPSYQDEFNFLWQNARDFGSRASLSGTTPQSVDRMATVKFSSTNFIPVKIGTRTNFHATIEPQNGIIASQYLPGIRNASKSIELFVSKPVRYELYKELHAALLRNVKVRIVTGNAPDKPCRDPFTATSANFLSCLIQSGAVVKHLPIAKNATESYLVLDRDSGFLASGGMATGDETKTLSLIRETNTKESVRLGRHFRAMWSR